MTGPCNVSVKFNLMNLNRQAKLYSQGMKPLYKILPHQPQWERIKEKPVSGVRTFKPYLTWKTRIIYLTVQIVLQEYLNEEFLNTSTRR